MASTFSNAESSRAKDSEAEEIDVIQLSTDFHSLYRTFHLRKNEKRQTQRRDKSQRSRSRQRCKLLADSITTNLPVSTRIDILGNCSFFAAYACTRQIVLEYNFADACRKWLVPLEDTEGENDNAGERANGPSPVSLPKTLICGLEVVFQLIEGSHILHPSLCVKSLESLLNILESQNPQSFRKEPASVIDTLFSILLNLSKFTKTDAVNIPSSSKSKSTNSSPLISVATACLISLSIARGDTKSMLEAIASLFMCCDEYASQEFKNPEVLKSLQRSTQATLVGRHVLPQWLSHGIPVNSMTYTYKIPLTPSSFRSSKSLASDGRYLYLHCSRGLFKIGSGNYGSVEGQHCHSNEELFPNETVWIGWAAGNLYCRILTLHDSKLYVIDQDTLQITSTVGVADEKIFTMFSDGKNVGMILSTKEDGFLVRTMSPVSESMETLNEFNLRLVRKSVEVTGPCPWDGDTNLRPVVTGVDDDVAAITIGKDFALLRTQHGRIMYCGKGASLGQKSGIAKYSKWLELGLSKCPRFVQCAVGHEGIHALLLAEDGTAYFVGTPKRGEDGDQAKIRRVAKASKPKKVIRMEGHDVTYIACNNGTSAFITRGGDCYMYGKDTAHCDPTTGHLVALRGVFITQIAMGKAHSVILSGDGKVYTMGIGNKGQCGRSFTQSKEDAGEVLNDDDEVDWEEVGATGGIVPVPPEAEQEGMCPSGTHRWKHEQCMVCTICRECTGYGSACISALRPDRNPGQECGCGVGDAGCAECGSCRTCAREGIEEQDYLALNPEELPEFIHMEDPRLVVPDPIQQDRKQSKPYASLNPTKIVKQKGKETAITSFPPSPLKMPTSYPIIQVACGLHHTVFLDSKGSVFACGSNTFGQLGLNDLSPRHTPTKMRFPDSKCKIIQIATGSFHTVCLDSDGIVYTCGAHSKGQLARAGDDNDSDALWFAKMVVLENTGVKMGRRVTWIGATGDCTFIRLEASLISPTMLQKSSVTANSSTIIIIPPPWTQKFASSIMINRRDGCCSYFEGENQVSVNTEAVCLDPIYDFLWTVQSNVVKCYNVIASGFRNPQLEANKLLSKPPFTVPTASNTKLQRWQAGANLLACMATLVSAHQQGLVIQPEEQAVMPCLAKVYSRDDYSSVCRFESHGGGWGYSGHSIEAIRFSCDADIVLGGFGLFGGRGENTAKIKVFDIGTEGGEIEGDGELLAETEEVPYECASRQKYRMMFQDPVQLQAGRWYVAWAHISGASSDCGSNGQNTVLSEEVMFHFKSSKKSNNGTDAAAGQLPSILYKILYNVDQANMGTKPKQPLEPVHLLSNDFVINFTSDSIQVLITLIGWCWGQLQNVEANVIEAKPRGELMSFVGCSCLRLIEFSINQVYKHKGCVRLGQSENLTMAESIGDVRSMLHNMISTPAKKTLYTLEILSQCCDTFINCFQVFYPTSGLKWECLANFMHLYLEKGQKYARMLGCVVGALCQQRGQLLGIFPVLNTIVRQSPDETSLTFVTNTEGGKLKQPANNRLLVGQMRCSTFTFIKPSWSFWDILDHILAIVDMDDKSHSNPMKKLIYNSSLLLAKLMEELVSHASGIYAELECSIGQIIVSTPSRFTRTNQSRTWNTGNGSPDAVCFTVDQPGVSLFGACIYSGTGTYEYELELVEDLGSESGDQSVPPKWTSLEIARGSFDSDECWGDIAEIKFNKPVLIKPHVKYALRLKNHGGRTCNGDGGVSILRCPDGTTFNFMSCHYSLNGTNQIRGQVPHILYFRNPDDSDARQKAKAIAETQARKCAHRICTTVFNHAKDMIENVKSANIEELSDCTMITTLLPSILAHLPHLGMTDPRSSVEILELIRRLLPSVSDLNNKLMSSTMKSDTRVDLNAGVHYAWVESDHPYKMATIMHYKITFPTSVQRMTVEFDPRCHTAQSEDSVQMYIPFGKDISKRPDANEDSEMLSSYISVMERFHGSIWPQKTIVLPGNEVLFSLETASDFVRLDRREYFGFRCLVSGFEWKNSTGLSRLEMELAFLGGFCAHQLLKKDLVLPPVSAEEVETTVEPNLSEDKLIETCTKHHALFAKGIGLEYFPTVQEALDGIVPLRFQQQKVVEKSKEREFVADFIGRVANSSGERLANWLQPESFVDPSKCEVVTSKEPIKRGKPTVIVIVTRDQYGEPAHSATITVELKAIPHLTSEQPPFVRSSHIPSTGLYKVAPGLDAANLEIPFQITVKDKMRYHAITMMKEYENYSFEELRLLTPAVRRASESMLIRQNNNATYTATWTPACTGLYYLSLSIDGYTIPQLSSVEVEEAPDGSLSLQPKRQEDSSLESLESHTGKMRRFKATDSAGLRIRSHPSLQSEQIGRLPINGVIRFTLEVHNDDGIWVKLNDPSVKAFCDSLAQTKSSRTEGWCLQYNQHLGKTLLFPVEGPKDLGWNYRRTLTFRKKMTESSLANADKSSKALRLNGSPGLYHVVNCGVSGHNIRSKPSLRSPSVGIFAMGMKFYSVDEKITNDGLWVKLDHVSQQKYCYTSEGEAWSLAVGKGDVVHLKIHDTSKTKKGFDFSVASQNPQSGSRFGFCDNVSPPAAFNSDLKSNDEADIAADPGSGFLTAADDFGSDEWPKPFAMDVTTTPGQQQQPKATAMSQGEKMSIEKVEESPEVEKSVLKGSSRSSSKSSSFSALQKWLQLGSSSAPELSTTTSSTNAVNSSNEMSRSLVKERVSALTTEKGKSVSSATQTSPEEISISSIPLPGQFNIGSAGGGGLGLSNLPSSTSKASPKTERKHKSSSCRPRSGRRGDREKERSKSPQPQKLGDIPAVSSLPVKSAVGPGQAQSVRAVFGAVLWNAGIVHDAMACSSYLRFRKHVIHPSSPQKELKTPTLIDEDELLTSILNQSKSLNEGNDVVAVPPETKSEISLPPPPPPSSNNEAAEQSPVVLRKKPQNPDSPAKTKQQQKQQRHSVEVTSAAWYLKENPQVKIEEFDLKLLCQEVTEASNIISQSPKHLKKSDSGSKAQEEPPDEGDKDDKNEYPPAMEALEKIWNFVKETCTEAICKDALAGGGSAVDAKSTPVKMRKDRKARSCSSMDSKVKMKKERPKQLQAIGRTFFQETEENRVEFLEEMQQCDLCQVRFPRKGKTRNVHFGLSMMCENCSERHLKLRKQQSSSNKLPSSSGLTDSSSLKYLSPTTESAQPHTTIMNNACFLLQMINAVGESHQEQDTSSIIPLKNSFNCYIALGITESQIIEESNLYYEENNSPDGRPDNGIHRQSPSAAAAATTIFGDTEFSLRRLEAIGLRRRKISNGDPNPPDESGFTLLNHPSAPLQKILDASKSNSEQEAVSKMCGSIINFVVEKHDLDNLKLFLFQAIRRVTCRSYGMQILAWMMRNVSQPTAMHDLLWWYASSLEIKETYMGDLYEEDLDNGWWQMRVHPLVESPSTIFPILTDSFHLLLQTISDVMPFLSIGSPLLEMAVKCWGVKFGRKDHKFLHRSKIFRNLSQIMSKFDGENDWSKSGAAAVTENNPFCDPSTAEVTTCLVDLTSLVDIKVSSRGALCPSLTDSSTETFWESGEEDRSRTKSITIVSSGDIIVKVLAVHVDNIRDSQYKVSSIGVKIGTHLDELTSVGHLEVDIRNCGWIWFPIECLPTTAKVFKMELKGPDNTLRARQIKILGVQAANQADGGPDKSGQSTLVARRKCENETLRIFRLLSSEVFGKLLNHVKRGDDDNDGNDLQEHVVGILFSRNKLTHLQKQVCSHIVGAIHREAIKIKEEFDSHITVGVDTSSILEATSDNTVRLLSGEKLKIADRYCFEMLSLVLALAGSKMGRSYLSQQSNLIQDLMHLLHVGTPRIQRQVTSVLRKILPEIKPDDFSKIICGHDLHCGEASTPGILDMILGCIIKSLQVKVRSSHDGNRSAKNISTSEIYKNSAEELPPSYWFLRGEGDMQLANTVVKLIKDMCEESFGGEWAFVTKPAISEAVLYLTKIDAFGRSSEECLVRPKFWISLAALCVLHPDHSKLLSSPAFQNGSTGRAKCVNHDDGETLAVIQCNECADLCAECDRFLHLPKKSWSHIRKVCKEEEESIKVDLHEGCGRIKLFWLMALADSSTLKALVEFRNEIPKSFTDSVTAVTSVGRCRFCNKVGNSGPLALGNVCGEPECQEYSKTSCDKIMECGHLCGGVRKELKCLPCLQGCSDKLGTILKQDGDDMCMICFTDSLSCAPAIQLLCGHVFHYHCCCSALERRWAGPRIIFSFSYCPICKADISHPLLEDILVPIRELFLDVERKSLMRLEYEGLNNLEAITVPGGRYYKNPAGFAMDRYAYYVCFKCKKAYFGGEARCDAEIAMEFDPSELVCGGCSDVSQAQLCPRHGTDFLEYKCRYCCSVAVFFCFGTTHFCNGCHDDFQRITAMPKGQLPSCPAGPRATQLEGEECPLHVFHPPTGEEFALGCGICRNSQTF